MKDGTSEWVALAEEAEAEKKWSEATTAWSEAATEAIGYDVRDAYIAKRDECDRKARKAQAQEWVPEANQSWLGVETKED